MSKWVMYQNEQGDSVAVKEGFNIWAFIFGWIWAAFKKLSGPAIVGLIATASLEAFPDDLALIAGLLALVIMLTFGFKGNQWAIADLEQRGYKRAMEIEASTDIGAKTKFEEMMASA